METFEPGERFFQNRDWDEATLSAPHIWVTLGYRRAVWEPGRQVVEWEATEDYCFPSASGPIVHGGMVSTILDTAMGGAAATLLDHSHAFLTADLRVEFLRATRPGTLRADGRVVRRARRVIFCAADLHDADGALLASARCTQIVLPAQKEAS